MHFVRIYVTILYNTSILGQLVPHLSTHLAAHSRLKVTDMTLLYIAPALYGTLRQTFHNNYSLVYSSLVALLPRPRGWISLVQMIKDCSHLFQTL